ncbi:gliding motility lipoprotein GldH [Paramuribaculum intestinale]|uniref:gliding motility lipoprotein GldH n=1 Tax=Paramuribaculum intestinale TaxID=2094151 RepID=UPI000FFED6D5|nr:gliding motility lipoprotein GldH [Paramuribaculum intestinale]RXE63054.1 gliding motility lipoprotein GldH [Muribaculaceae bacterium Isolate-004 (NCI)]
MTIRRHIPTAAGWLATVVLAAVAVSCGGNGEINSFAHIPHDGWAYGDTVKFDIDSAMRIVQPLHIALRHNDSYPYRNLYLEVSLEDDSHNIRRDTISIELCDIYGHWYGHGIGASMQIEAPTKTTVDNSTRRVNIRHVMRVDTLTGIELVGITGQSLKR